MVIIVMPHEALRKASLPPEILVKRGCGFNHKIMIIRFRSRHLVLWSLGNLMECESPSKELVVQGKNSSPAVHPT
jgi:hypothetical protein